MGDARSVGDQVCVENLDAVQDMLIPLLCLGFNAPTKEFMTGLVEHETFNLGAAEIYPDAIHSGRIS
jgi:hypothetical protein